ncbi:FAD/NAD(P)-binding domain-containing protein [Chaetoceros tenuissimus]|uniref:FAD/NAD(P)-binding domain-containing protein n=1 Tax=Chaetoceros tenuissimus TaxID=426638 RepID=A0AAD3CZR4_9STRA|nr:FAD/NAD(P)-binding domain-containing protein [Chaetoceros tenuissimus]
MNLRNSFLNSGSPLLLLRAGVLLLVLLLSSWTPRSFCFIHGFSSSRTRKGSEFLRKHPLSNNGVFFKSETLVLTPRRSPAAGSVDAQTIAHQKRSYSELFAREYELEEDLEEEDSDYSPAASELSYFSRTTFTGEEEQEDTCCEDTEFDMIVIGSGNGACGFLSGCLSFVKPGYKVLVLEEGQNFFYSQMLHIKITGPKAMELEEFTSCIMREHQMDALSSPAEHVQWEVEVP